MYDDDEMGCGISRWWLTAPNDPFRDSCDWHDKAYMDGSWAQMHMTRKEADQIFLNYMLMAAKGSLYLKMRAFLFYTIARRLGGAYWEGKL